MIRRRILAPTVGPLWLCETGNAQPLSPMHIRRLTFAGPRPGGGADTRTLCNRMPAWDVRPYTPEDRPVDTDREWTCGACLDALAAEQT